jgi:anti-sigma factor ChrR (cupin superfamily)
MHPNETTLNDYIDGSLGSAERLGVDQHLAACAECRQLVEDLRDLLRATGELELREPPVRAWSRLERAIRMEPQHADRALRPSDVVNGPSRGGNIRTYATWLAAAAALVLATMVGIRYLPERHRDPASAPGATASSAAGDRAASAAQSVETELRQAEAHYEKAIKGLEVIANTEQNELDPRTAATLQKNLAVIDQAISESRAAVRAQPASEPAQQSLIEGFKTKIGLLQDTVALINEMRKGNEAGAARIASGLKQKGT